MTKEENLKKDLKKARVDLQILKTENAILIKLNAKSNLPLCMNELINNLKKQNKMLEEENKRLLNKFDRI